MDNNPKAVLMVDDDPEDCMLAKSALEESGVKALFISVGDGVELMAYLSEHSRSKTKGLPSLILLDLNMPRKDGREALLEIKSEPALQHIPIVILTTSEERGAVTIKVGAEAFITKPATFDEWIEIMKSLAQRWLEK